jgi:hypothetical protein
VGNDLGVVYAGQNCTRQRERHDNLDEDRKIATPGECE